MKQDMKIISTRESTTTYPKDNDIKITLIVLLLLVIFNAFTTYKSFDKKN